MLSQKDINIIERLKLNGQSKYPWLSQGDIEYLIFTISKCSRLEDKEN